MHSGEDLINMYKLDKKHAIGLFCKRTGALLARCLLFHGGWITALRTVESDDGNDYIELLLKRVSKMLAEESIMPCTLTTNFNVVFPDIFRDIGFEYIHDYAAFRYETNGKNLFCHLDA